MYITEPGWGCEQIGIMGVIATMLISISDGAVSASKRSAQYEYYKNQAEDKEKPAASAIVLSTVPETAFVLIEGLDSRMSVNLSMRTYLKALSSHPKNYPLSLKCSISSHLN